MPTHNCASVHNKVYDSNSKFIANWAGITCFIRLNTSANTGMLQYLF